MCANAMQYLIFVSKIDYHRAIAHRGLFSMSVVSKICIVKQLSQLKLVIQRTATQRGGNSFA